SLSTPPPPPPFPYTTLFRSLLTSPDRTTRRTAYENYADAHLAMQHTMAASLAGGIKRDVFYARARRYASSIDAALEPNFIPADRSEEHTSELQSRENLVCRL